MSEPNPLRTTPRQGAGDDRGEQEAYQTLAAALQAIIEHAVVSALVSLPTPVASAPVMLSVSEAAAQLGVGTTKLKQLIASGQLASVSIGRRRLVPAAGLQAFTTNAHRTAQTR
jgi:excisionase family DNA binding protein